MELLKWPQMDGYVHLWNSEVQPQDGTARMEWGAFSCGGIKQTVKLGNESNIHPF